MTRQQHDGVAKGPPANADEGQTGGKLGASACVFALVVTVENTIEEMDPINVRGQYKEGLLSY